MLGDREDVAGRDRDSLCDRACLVLPEHPEGGALRLLARAAALAFSAGHRGVHEHPRSRLDALHALADAVDDPGRVRPEDVREVVLDAEDAPDRPQVQVVERGSRDRDPDLARARLGVGHLRHAGVLDAVRVDRQRLHGAAAERPEVIGTG